jgi:hypothetical protein
MVHEEFQFRPAFRLKERVHWSAIEFDVEQLACFFRNLLSRASLPDESLLVLGY